MVGDTVGHLQNKVLLLGAEAHTFMVQRQRRRTMGEKHQVRNEAITEIRPWLRDMIRVTVIAVGPPLDGGVKNSGSSQYDRMRAKERRQRKLAYFSWKM